MTSTRYSGFSSGHLRCLNSFTTSAKVWLEEAAQAFRLLVEGYERFGELARPEWSPEANPLRLLLEGSGEKQKPWSFSGSPRSSRAFNGRGDRI
jgi:hypothetical protein